jgi:hypothetical protein
LYYKQAVYNYKLAKSSAEVLQAGPTYCPSGSSTCTSYEALLKTCKKDQELTAILNVYVSIIKIAYGVLVPSPTSSLTVKEGAFQLFYTLKDSISRNSGLAANFSSIGGIAAWDPDTTMPPLGLGATKPSQYTLERSSFYLSAAKNLTESLVELSPAYWDSIYLEKEKSVAELKLNPPTCSETSRILTALSDYLSNVKKFTSYGTTMTSAMMSLAPVSKAAICSCVPCARHSGF